MCAIITVTDPLCKLSVHTQLVICVGVHPYALSLLGHPCNVRLSPGEFLKGHDITECLGQGPILHPYNEVQRLCPQRQQKPGLVQEGSHVLYEAVVEQLHNAIVLWCVVSGEATLHPLLLEELSE